MPTLKFSLLPTRTRFRRDVAPEIRAEIIRTLYSEQPRTVFSVVFVALLVTLGLWTSIKHTTLLSWLSLVLLYQVVPIASYLLFSHLQPRDDEMRFWGNLWTFITAVSSSLWGLAAFVLFVPGSPVLQAMLCVTITALTVSGAPLVARNHLTYAAHTMPALVPLAIRLLMEPHAAHQVLAISVLLALYGGLVLGRILQNRMVNLLEQKQQNALLMKQLRQTMIDAQQEREQALDDSQARTRFFAAVSHDLRQPLHAVGLYSATLTDRLQDPQERTMARAIATSVETLESHFNLLLDFARIDAGHQQARRITLTLRGLFERLRFSFGAEAQAKGLRLRIHCPDVQVHSDPVMLERILGNLLANAIRYTDQGGVLLAARRRGDQVSLEVWDTGPGIDPSLHDRIFDPYFRISQLSGTDNPLVADEPPNASQRSFGLGLSNVRKLAQQLDSTVGLHSRPGHGTVFKLMQPWADAPQSLGAIVEQAPDHTPPSACATGQAASLDLIDDDARPAPTPGFAQLRIIVLDDDPAIRQAMAQSLCHWGCHVLDAASLADCLARIDHLDGYPDLIITDYRLSPTDTGVQAIEQLRMEFGIPIPALIISALNTPEALATMRASGEPVFQKPLTTRQLRQAIFQVIQQDVQRESSELIGSGRVMRRGDDPRLAA